MSKPFDSVFKDLLERGPAGWVRLALGAVEGEPVLVDADISTVSGAADKVVLLNGPTPLLVHFEAFASWDPSVLARALFYNSAHHRRHLLPVHTALVVLRPEADHARLTGEYRSVTPVSGQTHLLEYQVIRAWLLDPEAVLQGPLSVLPLAPITDAAAGRLPEVLRRMEARLNTEVAPETRKDLWTDTFVLMGLRYPRERVVQLFRGIPAMRESETYQAILEEGKELGRGEGRLEGAIHALILFAAPRLGEPDAALRQRLESETNQARVEEWLQQVGRVESWSDLQGL